MSRRRTLVPIAAGGALALALIPALPASAATITWSQPGDSWWTTAAWSPVPGSGDHVVFDGGPRSTYNLGGTVVFDGFTFAADHLIANNGGVIGIGASGIALEPGVEAEIALDIVTEGAQTWTIPEGAVLTIPTWITTDGVGTLTFDVDGVLELDGNVDGVGTGAVVQTGSGTVVRTGGTGGAIADGYHIDSGVFLLAGAEIESTSVTVAGGVLEGAGRVGHLVVGGGELAPRAETTPWGGIRVDSAALTGGRYLFSADATSGAGDYIEALVGPISGAGTTLDVQLTGTPAIGAAFTVLGVSGSGSIDPGLRLLSPAGAVIEDGDQFDSNGHRWSMSYVSGPGGWVEIEYAGETPEEETPSEPAEDDEPELAVSGSTSTVALVTTAAVLLGGAALALLVQARRRARA